MGPRQVWTGEENRAPTGIRSPDRPVRSESLYLLRYVTPYSLAKVYRCTFFLQFNSESKKLPFFRKTVAQWLRCCVTDLKVAVSIPDGVIGIFH